MPEQLKIAVQLFGHLRTFEQCAPSLNKYLLQVFDCDVFIHTWSETEHRTPTWHKDKCTIRPVDEKIIQKLHTFYQPKALKIEDQPPVGQNTIIPCLHNDKRSAVSAQGVNFMLYSQIEVNKLRQEYSQKNAKVYDYVVMIRPDVLLETAPDFAAFDREISKTVDFEARFSAVNGLNRCPEFAFVTDLASDIFYFATPQTMDKIIQVLAHTDFTKETDGVWTPENLINKTLLKNNIVTLPLFYFSGRDWSLVRGIDRKKRRKQIIRLKISSRVFYLHLLSGLKFSLINLNLSIFKSYTIQISIGKCSCLQSNL